MRQASLSGSLLDVVKIRGSAGRWPVGPVVKMIFNKPTLEIDVQIHIEFENRNFFLLLFKG